MSVWKKGSGCYSPDGVTCCMVALRKRHLRRHWSWPQAPLDTPSGVAHLLVCWPRSNEGLVLHRSAGRGGSNSSRICVTKDILTNTFSCCFLFPPRKATSGGKLLGGKANKSISDKIRTTATVSGEPSTPAVFVFYSPVNGEGNGVNKAVASK